MDTITFNIRRFDGEDTWNQEYSFKRQVITLLGALNMIREELDDSLCFTQACRHSICGSCAITVNGSAYLACETQLDELIDTFQTNYFYLAPLNNFPVVRDLVVSFDEKAEKMSKVMPWMCPHEGRHDHKQSEADHQKYQQSTDCVLCGCCASGCSELRYSNDNYLEPFIMNKAYRFIRDSRDEKGEDRVRIILENDLWKCLHCNQCATKCPKGIPVSSEISYMRRMALRMGEDKSMGARHAYCFRDDLIKTGILNEAMLAVKTEGIVKCAANRIPFTMRMVLSGKMNPLHVMLQKPVKGIDGVRKLYEISQKMDKED